MTAQEASRFLDLLKSGELRAARRADDGGWQVDASVKEGSFPLLAAGEAGEIPGWSAGGRRQARCPAHRWR